MSFFLLIPRTLRFRKSLSLAMWMGFTMAGYADSAWNLAAWSTIPPVLDDVQELEAQCQTYRDLSYADLYQLAQKETEFVGHNRNKTEWAAWRFAHIFRLTDDQDAAKRSAILISGLADRKMPEAAEIIHIEGKWIPYPAVIAYGVIQSSNIWPLQIEKDLPPVEKTLIDQWLHNYADSFSQILNRPGQVTNYTPFGLRHAASLALVLKDPDLMTLCRDTACRLAFSNEFWHADLIWQEGTVSYARQVTGNLKALLPMLAAGLEAGWIQGPPSLSDLEQRLETIDQTQIRFSMPSGRPIPVHDTHWTIPSDALPRATRSIAFPDFGHFALKGPDVETHLSIPSLTGGGRYGGGHRHDSRLALSLWAHGQEILPDAGYPFSPENHRYFHMSPLAHNLSISVDPQADFPAGPYGVWGGAWARSSLIGYDDGKSHHGGVTYIAATSPGPLPELTKRAERHLIQVETGMWSGYVVDVFWIQGGKVHRSFLRQTEDEAVGQTVDAELIPDGKTMADVLGEPTEGDTAWSSNLRNPLKVGSEKEFHIQWSGKQSGVDLNIYVAPQPGSVSWLSQMPRLRPTNQDIKKKDDFPGWHLFRQREVEPEDLTAWAAIYEPVANGAVSLIDNVSWTIAPDQKGIKVEVTLGDRKDTWILAPNGSEILSINELELKGQAAGFSEIKAQLQWSWAATGSLTNRRGTVLADGGSADPFRVKSLTIIPSKEPIEKAFLDIEGEMELPQGNWAALKFADDSGRGIYLNQRLSSQEATSQFSLEGPIGMEINEDGMRRIAFPQHAVPGKVEIVPLGGTIQRYTAKVIEK